MVFYTGPCPRRPSWTARVRKAREIAPLTWADGWVIMIVSGPQGSAPSIFSLFGRLHP